MRELGDLWEVGQRSDEAFTSYADTLILQVETVIRGVGATRIDLWPLLGRMYATACEHRWPRREIRYLDAYREYLLDTYELSGRPESDGDGGAEVAWDLGKTLMGSIPPTFLSSWLDSLGYSVSGKRKP